MASTETGKNLVGLVVEGMRTQKARVGVTALMPPFEAGEGEFVPFLGSWGEFRGKSPSYRDMPCWR
jgi:hypothetical protein